MRRIANCLRWAGNRGEPDPGKLAEHVASVDGAQPRGMAGDDVSQPETSGLTVDSPLGVRARG